MNSLIMWGGTLYELQQLVLQICWNYCTIFTATEILMHRWFIHIETTDHRITNHLFSELSNHKLIIISNKQFFTQRGGGNTASVYSNKKERQFNYYITWCMVRWSHSASKHLSSILSWDWHFQENSKILI